MEKSADTIAKSYSAVDGVRPFGGFVEWERASY